MAIARALAASPRLLLMDEPLAALDLARKQEILPYLERLHDELEIPILYVSHAPDEVARLADHIVVMEAGRAVAAGPLAETLARLDLPIRLGEDAGVVLDGVVAERDETWHLARVDFPGGSLWVRDHGVPLGQPRARAHPGARREPGAGSTRTHQHPEPAARHGGSHRRRQPSGPRPGAREGGGVGPGGAPHAALRRGAGTCPGPRGMGADQVGGADRVAREEDRAAVYNGGHVKFLRLNKSCTTFSATPPFAASSRPSSSMSRRAATRWC